MAAMPRLHLPGAIRSVLDDQALPCRQFKYRVPTHLHKLIFKFSLPTKKVPAVVIEHDHAAWNYAIEEFSKTLSSALAEFRSI